MKTTQKILLLFLFLIILGCDDPRIFPIIKVVEVKLVDTRNSKYRISAYGTDGNIAGYYTLYTNKLYSVGDTLIVIK